MSVLKTNYCDKMLPSQSEIIYHAFRSNKLAIQSMLLFFFVKKVTRNKHAIFSITLITFIILHDSQYFYLKMGYLVIEGFLNRTNKKWFYQNKMFCTHTLYVEQKSNWRFLSIFLLQTVSHLISLERTRYMCKNNSIVVTWYHVKLILVVITS